MTQEQLLKRLRSDLRDWLTMLDSAKPGSKGYIDGRIQALSDVIELLTGHPEALFGECPHCKHMGYISPMSLQCPNCGRAVTAKEWEAQS